MTILPKKKQSKEKNEGASTDHSQLPHGQGPPTHGENRVVGRRPNSPPQRWGSPGPVDPGLTPHDPSGARFEDFSSLEGASGHKRRHRSSPHRNVRKHRWGEPSTHSHPSTSGHGHSHRHQRFAHDRLVDRPSTSSDRPGGTTSVEIVGPDLSELEDDEAEGYNSEDEYATPKHPENVEELEHWFEKTLKDKRDLTIKEMGNDGACLFRAVADQVYGDQEMHSVVRQNCCDYMAKNRDFFRQYVTEEFEMYLSRKRMDNSHGNHIEMQALSELYNRPIEVYQYTLEPINTFSGAYKTDNEPIRLSYHRNSHYNSVVNPYKATVGVGLGLPGFQPGLADKTLMGDAVKQSETAHLEQAMLQDKLKETDWEVTQETIEEQVARESYLQWLRDQEKRAQRQDTSKCAASAACSSACDSQQQQTWWEGATSPKSPEARNTRSPRNRSANNSLQNSPNRSELLEAVGGQQLPSPKPSELHLLLPGGQLSPAMPHTSSGGTEHAPRSPRLDGAVGGASITFPETASLINELPSQLFGISEWDEDELIAQVIAQSQQEYLDNLKKQAANTATAPSSSIASSASSSSGPSWSVAACSGSQPLSSSQSVAGHGKECHRKS